MQSLSFLPCDRKFAVIEKMKHRTERTEMFEGWMQLVESKFPVVSGDMILDFNVHLKKYVTKNKEIFEVSTKHFAFQITINMK